ncbi:MAG: S-methyl-5-thioribose-1-phosphate isomerase [Planctomycetes bacterium]|nr:S-methyl-5-thioribose-1-phosphate isomerase [Planctomycetota bacterium]
MISPISFSKEACLITILDQRFLPQKEVYRELKSISDVIDAIKSLAVRGAPLLGVTGSYAVCIAINESSDFYHLDKLLELLSASRPTAVNLKWAAQRVRKSLGTIWNKEKLLSQAFKIACEIHSEDEQMCRQIGLASRSVIKDNFSILTICNTGYLATGGQGSAFSCFLENMDKNIQVFAMETRPLLQGARLTMYELRKAKIASHLIADSAAAVTMLKKKINIVITGSDRVASNGDAANKIGTFQIAIASKYHNIPFYIACPTSTFDLHINSGNDIPVEERHPEELLTILGNKYPEYSCYNPAFDVTPAELITGYITEKGILNAKQIKSIV